jgi:hypothetical protein
LKNYWLSSLCWLIMDHEAIYRGRLFMAWNDSPVRYKWSCLSCSLVDTMLVNIFYLLGVCQLA